MTIRPFSSADPRITVARYQPVGSTSAERHSAWVNRWARALSRLYDTVPLEPFDSESDTILLGDVVVTYSRITAQDWYRGADHIREDGADALAINWRFIGGATGEADGRPFHAGAGSLIFTDLSRVTHHRSERSQTILLVVPRAIAIERYGSLDSMHGLVIDSPTVGLLGNYLQQIRNAAQSLSVADGVVLGNTALELLGIALKSPRQEDESDRNTPDNLLKRRACAIIDGEIQSGTLNVASLCRTMNVSRSRLFSLFAEDHGVETYIRNRRLDHARFLLLDPTNEDRIGEIAMRLGFADQAHFSRAFRKRFGLTPSAFRELGIAG